MKRTNLVIGGLVLLCLTLFVCEAMAQEGVGPRGENPNVIPDTVPFKNGNLPPDLCAAAVAKAGLIEENRGKGPDKLPLFVWEKDDRSGAEPPKEKPTFVHLITADPSFPIPPYEPGQVTYYYEAVKPLVHDGTTTVTTEINVGKTEVTVKSTGELSQKELEQARKAAIDFLNGQRKSLKEMEKNIKNEFGVKVKIDVNYSELQITSGSLLGLEPDKWYLTGYHVQESISGIGNDKGKVKIITNMEREWLEGGLLL